jgi:hypothetical protein
VSANSEPIPGRLLLRLARFAFSREALDTIIEPAAGDLQREVQQATPGRARLLTQVRGYTAFWKVLLLAALVPSTGAGSPLLSALLGLNGGFLVAFLAPLLFAGMWPTFGVFTVSAVVAGFVLAFGLAVWNDRHPTAVACTRRVASTDPEINLSAIHVGGNIGGFFFVLASSLTVLLGLPELRGFVFGAVVGGAAMAGGLFAWRHHHLESPVRRIVVR